MKKSTIIPIAVLLLLIIVAYWQIAFAKHMVLWDYSNATFSYRYYTVECLRNGYIPAWLPYQYTGLPFFADPSTGWLYPVVWILSLFGRYLPSIGSLEYVLTFLAGGLGMYQLAKVWCKNNVAALFAAICYTCWGVFVSNAEHATWVVSCAWLPWLFWSYYQLIDTMQVRYAGYVAIFTFLLLTGGYPAFLIICFYIFLLIFITLLFQANFRRNIWQHLKLHAIMILLIAGSSFAFVFSVMKGMQESTRGSGVSLTSALTLPFSPSCFSTLLFPFASLKNDAFYQTDLSMRNGYISLAGLAFFLLSFFQKKDGKYWLVTALNLICVLASLGDAVPFRAFLYKHVPLMNLFQYPSIFRIYFLTGFLLLAATAFREVNLDYAKWRKPLIAILILFMVVFVWVIIIAPSDQVHVEWGSLRHNMSKFIQTSTFWSHLYMQAIIQVVITASLLAVILSSRARFKTSALLVVCAIDLILSVQLNMYGTIVDTKPQAVTQAEIKKAPEGFPLPDNTIPVYLYIDANFGDQYKPVFENTLMIQKVLGIDGYDPFRLKRYDTLLKSGIKDSVWHNPPAYFANALHEYDTLLTYNNKRDACLSGSDLEKIRAKVSPTQGTDNIFFTGFTPNYMSLKTKANGSRLMVLQQNNADGWKAKIDGQETEWAKTNIAYMGVVVQPGEHQVEFIFRPKKLYTILLFSGLCLLLCVLIAFFDITRYMQFRKPTTNA